MTILEIKHWLHLEDADMGLANIASSQPTTTGINTSDPDEPACWEWDFGTNDDVDLDNSSVYDRTAADTPIGFEIRFKVTSLDAIDDLTFFARSDSSGSDAYCGIDVTNAGALRMWMGTNVIARTVLGSFPGGSIQDGEWHTASFRNLLDNSSGVMELTLDGSAPVSFSGDTSPHTGSLGTLWGFGAYMNSDNVVSGLNVRVAHITILDDESAPIAPQVYEWLEPDGVTADDDGTPTGAATNHEATDETPSDGGTTYMAMPVGKQGFAFADRVGTGAQRSAQLWGMLADPAAGSEVVNSFLSDGTEVDSPALAMPSSFAIRPLGDLIESAPSGGALDVDALTGGLERAS